MLPGRHAGQADARPVLQLAVPRADARLQKEAAPTAQGQVLLCDSLFVSHTWRSLALASARSVAAAVQQAVECEFGRCVRTGNPSCTLPVQEAWAGI